MLISPISKIKESIYLKDFNSKKSLKWTSIFITAYFLRDFIYKGIGNIIISPFHIDEVKHTIDLDILGVLVTLGIIIYLLNTTIRRKLFPCIDSVIIIILITGYYITAIRFSNAFILESFVYTEHFKYLDVLLLILLIFTVNFKYYSKKGDFISLNGFIEDSFHPEINTDFLGRKEYAAQVTLKILDTLPLKKAFVIAINSQWGFGKSGFMALIQELLSTQDGAKFTRLINSYSRQLDGSRIPFHMYENLKNSIVIKYNPWKNFDEKILVKDFFSEFASEIKKYDVHLASTLMDYSNCLSKMDESTLKKLVEITVENFKEVTTLNHLFDSINSSIERIQKRMIIFIDDLDRLTGDELIDVIKLIRNTANFKNTFFILAYDHNYVLNTIDKRNLISNKEEYLQKIVQLEITLPVFRKESLLVFLDEELLKSEIFRQDIDRIRIDLNEIYAIEYTIESSIDTPVDGVKQNFFDYNWMDGVTERLIYMVFQNVRDVIRFINSFKLVYEAIGSIGDGYEIILLELLKIRYLSVYNVLSKKIFLEFKEGKYNVNEEVLNSYFDKNRLESINIGHSDFPLIKRILALLFNPNRKRLFRSIVNPIYFDLYFSYHITNLVSLVKIENALKANIETLIELVDKSYSDGSINDLRSFLDTQTIFTSKEEFEMVLKSLFYISKYDEEK